MSDEPKYSPSDELKEKVRSWNENVESVRKMVESLFLPDEPKYEDIHGGHRTLKEAKALVTRLYNTEWSKLRDVWSEDLDKYIDEYKKWSELTKATKI